jgi:excisionase family DNA binding protein
MRPDKYAELLNVGEGTIHSLLKSGRLRSVKLAGRRVIPTSAIEALLEPKEG